MKWINVILSVSTSTNPNKVKHICQCCDSDITQELFAISFFKKPIRKCKNCDYIFTAISDTELDSFLDEYYQHQYWKWMDRNDSDFEQKIKRMSWLGLDAIRATSQHKFLKNYSGKVLDIGAGKGDTSRVFSENNCDVTIIEPDKENTKKLQESLPNVKVINGEFETITLNEKFDVIIMSHILEHVKNTTNFLNSAKKLLSSDGVIFIEVPDCTNPEILENSIYENPHVSHFTRKSLEFLLKKSNFDIIKFDTVFFNIKGSSKYMRGMKFLKYKLLQQNTYITCSDDAVGDAFRIIIKP